MKTVSLYLMIALYFFAGINHFVDPGMYISIMPHWLPWHEELVLVSGILEILFALLLVFPSTRQTGGWCIILLLVFVFPANVQMMLNYINENNTNLWIAVIRLPLQILLIFWAYSFTRPVKK